MIGNINISGLGFGVVGVLSDPPTSPVQGADYGVGQNATGAWAGHEGKVARADASQVTGWLMIEGVVLLYDTATQDLYDKPNGHWEPAPTRAGDPGPVGPAGPPGSGGGGGAVARYNLALSTPFSVPNAANASPWSPITVPAGAAFMSANFNYRFSTNATGAREAWIDLDGALVAADTKPVTNTISKIKGSCGTGEIPVTPGQIVQAVVYHNAGATLTLDLPTTFNIAFHA